MVKSVLPLLMAVCLLGASVPPAAASEKEVKGSFTASAKPLPGAWFLPTANGCHEGVEGVHKVTHPFIAPFAGWLRVDMRFQGDWDLGLVDASGAWVAGSAYQENWGEELERMSYFVEKGDELGIVACNWASVSDAEVRYTLREGPAWPTTPRRKTSRLETLSYSSPAAATSYNYVICYVGLGLGCTATEPRSSDRSVRVEVVDDMSPNVAFELYQYHGDTYLSSYEYCGSMPERVPLSPRADWVGVTLYAGPCGDGTPAMATAGKVLMRFSSR